MDMDIAVRVRDALIDATAMFSRGVEAQDPEQCFEALMALAIPARDNDHGPWLLAALYGYNVRRASAAVLGLIAQHPVNVDAVHEGNEIAHRLYEAAHLAGDRIDEQGR